MIPGDTLIVVNPPRTNIYGPEESWGSTRTDPMIGTGTHSLESMRRGCVTIAHGCGVVLDGSVRQLPSAGERRRTT